MHTGIHITLIQKKQTIEGTLIRSWGHVFTEGFVPDPQGDCYKSVLSSLAFAVNLAQPTVI